jgi:ribulose-bisphosphate carboxylase large chain
LSYKKKIPLSSCDWEKPASRSRTKINKKNKSKLYRFKGDFLWQGIKTEKYKSNLRGWAHVVRRTLIGAHGETSKFHLRYFEIAPRGYSSFEVHKHEHVVIGIRGKGICSIGKKKYPIGFLDILYIEPYAPHQLKNPFRKPFGFFCIVNAKRDKPKILI